MSRPKLVRKELKDQVREENSQEEEKHQKTVEYVRNCYDDINPHNNNSPPEFIRYLIGKDV